MTETTRGFTLIEVLIAAGILVCGLVGVAAIFSYAIRANSNNRQMAIATTLAYDKMEELRANAFGGIIPATSVTEAMIVAGQRFTRSWQVDSNVPRTVTVIVYANTDSVRRRKTELIRLTTLISPVF
jgi:prepilin-type N-terminal cleavage/methylation domain-containing protein